MNLPLRLVVYSVALLLQCCSGYRPPTPPGQYLQRPVQTSSVIARSQQFGSYSKRSGFVTMIGLDPLQAKWSQQVGSTFDGHYALPASDALVLYASDRISLVAPEGRRDFSVMPATNGGWVKARQAATFVSLDAEAARLHIFAQGAAGLWALDSSLSTPSKADNVFISANGEHIVAIQASTLAYDLFEGKQGKYSLSRQCPGPNPSLRWIAGTFDSDASALVAVDSEHKLYSVAIGGACANPVPLASSFAAAVTGINALESGRLAVLQAGGLVSILAKAEPAAEFPYRLEANHSFACEFPTDYLALAPEAHGVICLDGGKPVGLDRYTFSSLRFVGGNGQSLAIDLDAYASIQLEEATRRLYMIGEGAFSQVFLYDLVGGTTQDLGYLGLKGILN